MFFRHAKTIELRGLLRALSVLIVCCIFFSSTALAQSNQLPGILSSNPPSSVASVATEEAEPKSTQDALPKSAEAAESLICPAPSAFELEVFTLINSERSSQSLIALQMDYRLAVAARRLTDDMFANCFLSHTGSDGSSAGQRISDAGYPGNVGWGEIAAAGQTSPQQVVNSWMNSTGHRANILGTSFTHVGVSHVGASGSCLLTSHNITVSRNFWNVDFGASSAAPETGCSAPPPDTTPPAQPTNVTSTPG